MPHSPKIRDRLTDRINSSDEGGFVLIFVLILSVALITMLTFAVTSSVGNLTNAASYGNSTQAQNSAMTGLSIATDQMATAGSVTKLPCSVGTPAAPNSMLLPQVSNTPDTYSVAITYYDAGVADTCTPGSGPATPPTSAVLASTGTTAHTTPVTMQETMVIDATSTLIAAFNDAMFSQNTMNLTTGLTVNKGPGGTLADVYGGVVNTCQNSSFVDGNVQVASTLTAATLTIGNRCEITGDLYVNGSVILKNNAKVDGSIHAYGGDVTLNNGSSVGGSIYASAIAGVGGNINIDTNLCTGCDSVGGSLYATHAVTADIGGVVQDVISGLPLLQVLGSVNFPVASGSMPAAPVTQTFPQLSPTAATLATSVGDANGDLYNVIQIGGSGQPACTDATYGFLATAAKTYTTPTAIYAPTCVVSMSGSNTFSLGSNEIWVVGGLNDGGSLTVQSSTGTTFDLSVVVPFGSACPAGDINLNGNTFAASIKVALYTPCDVSLTGDQTIDGQIVAGGSVTTTGDFTLYFDQSASTYLPGTQGAPVLTFTVTGKTVTHG